MADLSSEHQGGGVGGSGDVLLEMGAGNENNSNRSPDECDEPAKKVRKLNDSNINKNRKSMERLESRLGGILCCAVCLDLPNSAVFQV